VSATETRYCYRHPDRETGLSCSECGRPICVDCMTAAPVGIRCPEHSGKPRGTARVTTKVKRVSGEGTGAIVTRVLIAINVIVYVAELAQGAGLYGNSGSIYEHGALVINAIYSNGAAAGLAHGEWWRLLTAAFLHYGPIHLGFNMLALWLFGGVVEQALGRWRFLLLYLVSGLAGSAGALLANPHAITVGASGAIFGILGALFILEYQATGSFTGQAMTLIALNLALSFAWRSNISWGGHLGGLVGGILGMLAFSRFGRGHAAYGRLGIVGTASLVAIGVASVLIAYWKVKGVT
jgi:membrane associated rhomboid family serine protease